MLFGVPISFDPFACILGVIAVWLAWVAFRSSTYHLVRVENVEASWRNNVHGSECGPSFEVTIINCGLPIHGLKVFLSFVTDEDFPMTINLELKPWESPDGTDGIAFDKGMRSLFVLRPLHEKNSSWFETKIQTLKNPRKQNAAIVVKSGSFTAQTIPLVSKMNPLLQRWNDMATSVKWRLSTKIKTPNGTGGIRTRNWIPVFGLRASFSLLSFVSFCKGMNETHQRFQSVVSTQKEATQQ